jgi:hypothetical protein
LNRHIYLYIPPSSLLLLLPLFLGPLLRHFLIASCSLLPYLPESLAIAFLPPYSLAS